MKSNFKVSVLINNYNYGQFIGEAIDSVLRQTYQNWELIIVDDGSADNSKEIIDTYVGKHPEKIRSIYKENSGQASAFNVGVEASNGDIIAFLDSDDYWFNDKLEKIVAVHQTSEFVGHAKHFSNGKKEDANLLYRDRRREFLREYGFMNNMGLFTTTLSFSRELADRIFPMPEKDFRVSADYYTVIFAFYYTDVTYLEEELSFYRIHGKNLYICDQNIFGEPEKLLLHNQTMDRKVREQINIVLQKENKPIIPALTNENRCALWKAVDSSFSIKAGGKYILYGTGSKAIKYEKVIEEFDGRVVGFADSNEKKWGMSFRDKKIYSPQELVDMKPSFDEIIISSVYFKEIGALLDGLGFKKDYDYSYAEIGI